MLLKYVNSRKRDREFKMRPRRQLKDGLPCKLDAHDEPIIDPKLKALDGYAYKTLKDKGSGDTIDPSSIGYQHFFVIEGSSGNKMIYREDSVKNLMNNSIVRYNDPKALEKAKKQSGSTVRFQFSCVCKGGRFKAKSRSTKQAGTNGPCPVCS